MKNGLDEAVAGRDASNMYDLDFTQSLAIQLERPLLAWWEVYFEEPHRHGGPDKLLRAEVQGFIELVRARTTTMFGGGVRADHIAILMANAGMLARNLDELDRTLWKIADWYDYYSPKSVRRAVAHELRMMGVVRRYRPLGRTQSTTPGRSPFARLKRWISSQRGGTVTSLPGSRMIDLASSTLVIGVGIEGEMHTGIVIDGNVQIIMSIDDRDGRDPRPVPEPTPELVA